MSDQFPNRKRIRLKEYDYSTPGYYFITINTKDDILQLSSVENKKIKLSEAGIIVDNVWKELPGHYANCELDEYVIMPDHFHGIIKIIKGRESSEFFETNKKHNGLPEIIRGFKTFSSKLINEKIKPGSKFKWQKSYYDRIIRDELELNNVRKYIINNPMNLWNEQDN